MFCYLKKSNKLFVFLFPAETLSNAWIRDVEAAISSTASTPIASASTNKKREYDR